MADDKAQDKPAGGKVVPFSRPRRRNRGTRRPGPRGTKPPTQLTSSVQLILSRLGLCGAD